ncbi:hypothetical protein FA95DRAFT_686423 [Auriscalpium vulgare]|uniref:Uncharacterized protein n=1 Tax=Auriscalpium vulgare TaxID=40419 RepID=A0ACB8S165_9AGAM|nr:hypothetical protein FA95DRAFT_686423 [Auriscalpium vulgare]
MGGGRYALSFQEDARSRGFQIAEVWPRTQGPGASVLCIAELWKLDEGESTGGDSVPLPGVEPPQRARGTQASVRPRPTLSDVVRHVQQYFSLSVYHPFNYSMFGSSTKSSTQGGAWPERLEAGQDELFFCPPIWSPSHHKSTMLLAPTGRMYAAERQHPRRRRSQERISHETVPGVAEDGLHVRAVPPTFIICTLSLRDASPRL